MSRHFRFSIGPYRQIGIGRCPTRENGATACTCQKHLVSAQTPKVSGQADEQADDIGEHLHFLSGFYGQLGIGRRTHQEEFTNNVLCHTHSRSEPTKKPTDRQTVRQSGMGMHFHFSAGVCRQFGV
jgi:hypothetical protein